MRTVHVVIGVAAAAFASLSFWPSPPEPAVRPEEPERSITRRASLPMTPQEPMWQTRLRTIPSEPDATQRAADLMRLAGSVPVAQLRVAIDDLQSEAEDMPGGQLRLLLLRRWARQAPAAAAAWALEQTLEGKQTAALVSVGYGLAESSPSSAVSLAEQLPAGQDRTGLLRHAVQLWAAHEPVAAANWVERLRDQKSRDDFLGILTLEWASEEPALAAEFAAGALTAGQPRDHVLLLVADRWARVAPEHAAVWIANLPASESEVRDLAIGQLATTWARRDAISALEWLLGLPDDCATDAGLSGYIRATAARMPELAAQLVDEIQDPVVRSSALEYLSRP